MDIAGEGMEPRKGDIIAYARVRRISVVEDLWTRERWRTVAKIHGQLRSNRFLSLLTFLLVLQFLGSTEGLDLEERKLHQLRGWDWADIGETKSAWVLPMDSWRTLLGRLAPDLSQLNRRWELPAFEPK